MLIKKGRKHNTIIITILYIYACMLSVYINCLFLVIFSDDKIEPLWLLVVPLFF